MKQILPDFCWKNQSLPLGLMDRDPTGSGGKRDGNFRLVDKLKTARVGMLYMSLGR